MEKIVMNQQNKSTKAKIINRFRVQMSFEGKTEKKLFAFVFANTFRSNIHWIFFLHPSIRIHIRAIDMQFTIHHSIITATVKNGIHPKLKFPAQIFAVGGSDWIYICLASLSFAKICQSGKMKIRLIREAKKLKPRSARKGEKMFLIWILVINGKFQKFLSKIRFSELSSSLEILKKLVRFPPYKS